MNKKEVRQCDRQFTTSLAKLRVLMLEKASVSWDYAHNLSDVKGLLRLTGHQMESISRWCDQLIVAAEAMKTEVKRMEEQ